MVSSGYELTVYKKITQCPDKKIKRRVTVRFLDVDNIFSIFPIIFHDNHFPFFAPYVSGFDVRRYGNRDFFPPPLSIHHESRIEKVILDFRSSKIKNYCDGCSSYGSKN